ncbi:hypothetical protein THAOC_15676 [Thalassiosira oceanica]|uniref:Uncharacterized protein n=1 Tax=Thalassiosira oceanica TaxID=159749 RepID=K0SF93_THAOC|nr:hypothetical protein THAOC_15676 [Thalassiosira oceanica]|eukprot:EJK63654.1 hypothetical protein THAOC_15676 [Thalassiosira oceanica]
MLLLLSSFFGGTCEVGAARGSIRTPEDAAPARRSASLHQAVGAKRWDACSSFRRGDGKVVPGVEEADGSVVIVDEPDPRHVADDVARLAQQEMEVPRPLGEEEARHVRGHLGKIGTVQDRVGHFRVGARSLAALT